MGGGGDGGEASAEGTGDGTREGTGEGADFAAFVLRARALGVTDARTLNAIEAGGRARYVAPADRPHALTDHALPLPCGQASDRLDDLAVLVAALDLAPHHRVLEIGTGSGFATAVIAGLAARVVTCERYRTLLRAARERHARAGLGNIEYLHADGRGAPPDGPPFDRIVSSVALPEPPRHFIERMAPDGVAVIPVGSGEGPVPVMRLARVGVRFERAVVGTGWFPPAEPGVARSL